MTAISSLSRDLDIAQNSTFQIALNLLGPDNLPFNLTGYTPKAQIRKTYQSAIIAQFDCHIADYLSGRIYLAMTDEQTKLLPVGNCVYDVLLEDNTGNKFRALEGILTVSPYVTE